MSSRFDPDDYIIQLVGLTKFLPNNHCGVAIVELIWDGLVLGMTEQSRAMMGGEGEDLGDRFAISDVKTDILLFCDLADIFDVV